jgi:hypothetical protein
MRISYSSSERQLSDSFPESKRLLDVWTIIYPHIVNQVESMFTLHSVYLSAICLHGAKTIFTGLMSIFVWIDCIAF